VSWSRVHLLQQANDLSETSRPCTELLPVDTVNDRRVVTELVERAFGIAHCSTGAPRRWLGSVTFQESNNVAVRRIDVIDGETAFVVPSIHMRATRGLHLATPA
jgi:hypothetical protein